MPVQIQHLLALKHLICVAVFGVNKVSMNNVVVLHCLTDECNKSLRINYMSNFIIRLYYRTIIFEITPNFTETEVDSRQASFTF